MKLNFYKYIFLITIFSWLIPDTAHSNSPSEPVIGKACPPFVLNQIINYKSKSATLSDFKGKWTFIDFWATTCTSCIASFKKIDAIQRTYSERVQFMLVGKLDDTYNRNIREVFAKISKLQDLTIPSAFDSVLFKDWGVGALPTIFVIDPNGTLRYVTDGRDLTKEKVAALIRNEVVTLYEPGTRIAPVDGTEDFTVLYRSQVKRWDGGKQAIYDNIDRWLLNPPQIKQKGWTVRMAPLYMLYNLAYLGACVWQPDDSTFYAQYFPYPILDMSDTTQFAFDFVSDVGQNTFDYELILTGEYSKEKIMRSMQESLKDAFGYNVVIERRQMPVWTFKEVKPGSSRRIATKGGEPFDSSFDKVTGYKDAASGFTVRNQPLDVLLRLLTNSLKGSERRIYLNSIPLRENVDFKIEADMLDLASVRREIQKQGLDLEKSSREMHVLVITLNDK